MRAFRTAGGGPRVLVTDDVNGQNRAAVSAVRALGRSGFRPVVSTCGRYSVAACSRHCMDRIHLPAASETGYAEALHRELQTGTYLTVLPASDVALLAVGGPGADLVHKGVLAERAKAAGLETLPGRVFGSVAQLRNESDQQTYPLLVKSAVKSGQGDLQAQRIDHPAQLGELPDTGSEMIVQPFVAQPLRAVAGVTWEGAFLALAHQRYERLWPPQAGVGAVAVTVEPDYALEEPLLRLLSGHNGIFQAQFVGPYLVDLNPRVYGSISLAVAAGANLPAIAAEAARGRVSGSVRARLGVRYRWLEGDLRNLIGRRRAGQAGSAEVLRQLRPRSGTAHSIESITDPLPGLLRLSYALRGGAG